MTSNGKSLGSTTVFKVTQKKQNIFISEYWSFPPSFCLTVYYAYFNEDLSLYSLFKQEESFHYMWQHKGVFKNQNQTAFVQYILVYKCIQNMLIYTHFEIIHAHFCGPFSLLFSLHFALCLFLWEGIHSLLSFKILWELQLHLFESI